jgi:hypothetical protein
MSKKQSKKRKGVDKASFYYSSLAAHKLERGILVPPLNRMEKMHQSSWLNDHLPLMLWASLLGEVLGREDFLSCLRNILVDCAKWFSLKGPLCPPASLPLPHERINYTSVLDLQTLATMPDELFGVFVEIPLRHPFGCSALRPLLLLNAIPNIERWRAHLGAEPQEADWETLSLAVAATLNHQSQRSTDIRWFKMMTPILAGTSHYPASMSEMLDEFYSYPNKGNQNSVQSSVRASEMMMRRNPTPSWVTTFWNECASRTVCIDPTDLDNELRDGGSLLPETVVRARAGVIERFFQHQKETHTDPKLDSAFGLVLYSLSIAQELVFSGLHSDILGRLSLRAIVESHITLRYLASKDDNSLWRAWRVYGAGQAKLAFLKAQEAEKESPKFVDLAELERIANEDQWQEFLDIDVGHWNRTNLRTLARDAGCLDTYDQYYSWTSSYTHSHWGSVRDTNFITCHNPLHRLHRIPRLGHRKCNNVEADMVALLNGMLETLELLYSGENKIHRLGLVSREQTTRPISV